MNTTWCRGVPAALGAWILLLLSGCAGGEAAARPESPATPGSASQAAAEPRADAEAILMGMAKFLSQAQRFTVSIRGGYDAVQASGEKIEFGYLRKVTLADPTACVSRSSRATGIRISSSFRWQGDHGFQHSAERLRQGPEAR